MSQRWKSEVDRRKERERKERYIDTDLTLDILSSLEQCAFSLTQALQSDRHWKWVILSLHSALQGAMVCHLTGRRGTGALTEKWTAFPCNVFDSQKKLASSSKLFERLCGVAKRYENDVGQVIQISKEQKSAFRELHRFRNDYTHLTPRMRSSIARFHARWIVEEVIEMMRLIAADPYPFRKLKKPDKALLNSKIEQIRSLVKKQSGDAPIATGK